MIYVVLQDDTKIVSTVHHMPFDKDNGLNKTKGELLEKGFFSEKEIPLSQTETGKNAILCYDPSLDNFFFEHEERPLTAEEKVQQLEQDLGNVLFENAMDKERISELEASQGDLLMEIAILKMGGNA